MVGLVTYCLSDSRWDNRHMYYWLFRVPRCYSRFTEMNNWVPLWEPFKKQLLAPLFVVLIFHFYLLIIFAIVLFTSSAMVFLSLLVDFPRPISENTFVYLPVPLGLILTIIKFSFLSFRMRF